MDNENKTEQINAERFDTLCSAGSVRQWLQKEAIFKKKGLFVVFEGGEGSGKSTQAKLLRDTLVSLGFLVTLTREPGGTLLGQHLRRHLLHGDSGAINSKAEAFLFMADRAQHVADVIRPALNEGHIVICDRYEASTMAYQCYGSALSWGFVKGMSEWASDNLQPDVVYFLDVPVEMGLERAKKAEHTSFEDKDVEFHEKVRDGYLAQTGKTWVILNGEESRTSVHREIYLNLMGLVEGLRTKESTTEMGVTAYCHVCSIQMEKSISDRNVLYCTNGHGHIQISSDPYFS